MILVSSQWCDGHLKNATGNRKCLPFLLSISILIRLKEFWLFYILRYLLALKLLVLLSWAHSVVFILIYQSPILSDL